MLRVVLSVLWVLAFFEICHCDDGFYTIVVSENLRPHSDYRVSVSIHNQSTPVTIKLSIEDEDDTIVTKEVTLTSDKTELINLPVDDLIVNNNFKFTAEGIDGIIFKNVTLLNVESKNCSIFIQTDKAIYKPGESIKFRILVLDFNLKPIELDNSHLKVYIMDSEKNRIKQWKESQLNTGIFSAELPLSESPVLGDWTITAEVGEEVKSKTLQIEEYVLPKFDVKIDSSEHFNVKDGKIRAIIRSKYTYGKLVKGRAIVTVKPTSYLAWSTRRETDTVAKTIPIDGKGTIELDITDDLHIQPDEFKRSTTYALSAVVVEELTGRNQSASKDITIHQLRYKIKALDLDPQFQSGIPVRVMVAVTYQDDKPVHVNYVVNRDIVILKIPNNKNLSETYTKHELSNNGTVLVSIPTSKKDESGFILKAKYMDEDAEIGYLFPSSNVEPTNLEIKVLTKKPTLNKEIFVEIQSTDILEHFTYQIISQGRLVYSDSFDVPQRNYHVFNFLATFDLLPTAHLIVYYFKNDEIVSNKIDIDIRDNLNNFIKVKLSETRIQPGDSVNIDIITKPKSRIGLLGVDQSVLLLKKNNDLSIEDAWNERELYQYQFYERNARLTTFGHSPYFYNKYWGDFQSTRMILFTNAKQDVYPIIRESYKPLLFNKAGVAHPETLTSAMYANQPSKIQRHPSQPPTAAPSHVPKMRKDFPETWLWQTINIDDENGTYSMKQNVPDTITSWVISAFSIDPITGLGLTKKPRVLEVFQPFFVSLNLPYSMKLGEILSIPVAIFNYMEIDTDADVTIHNNNNEFEFIEDTNQNQTTSSLERSMKLTIVSNHGSSTSFKIRPKKIGAISIKVTATSPLAGDSIVQILHVEPEGIAKFKNKALFVDLNDVTSFESMLTVDIPDDIILDSLKIDVNCVGDLLGGTIKNLNKLIRLPSGCGEQNMLNFVPNIVILKYLKVVGQLKAGIERKIKLYTEKGYQRELTYRHNDGSFSAFGKSDKSGSTWLTAFVAKSFRQAASFIDVDENIIDDALKWLSKKQNKDGSFLEIGTVSHKAMQGGSGKGVALTAYVLTAFLENRDVETTYDETINKAIDYITKSLEAQHKHHINDIYALAVAAYAMQLADHPNKDDFLAKLLKKATTKDETKWLSRYEVASKNSTNRSSKTLNIEITSYGLLAILESGQFADGFPYFKFLLSQRNNKGGFIGTQDTVMGLQALAKFAERISIRDNNIEIMVHTDNLPNHTYFNVNPENALIYQSHELPSTIRAINITANGHGFALFQLSYKYHTNKIEMEPSFKLKPNTLNNSNEAYLKLQVCVTYEPIKSKEKRTNMVILEVALPSGYVAESDTLINVSNSYNVKKVETKNADTIFIVYFDNFEINKEICPVFDAFRAHKIAEQKPVPISVYDYYDSSDRATAFYSAPQYNNII
ncbi:CD109 antigen-like [Contarinia nasturtii]|uniref:CD109 antigen-like n=1 Tax=Contarinia nasturtii TaxID=265458 RepID=UPI0012D41C5E|nr:CD109 antigen-like [Contarinia nasturtii]